MLTDVREMLDAVADKVNWPEGRVRTKLFRHTYCAARLQTTDRGQPVSKYTVARELGQGGSDLVDRVYGHLGEIRHRAEEVEYRPENHMDTIVEKIRALRAHGKPKEEATDLARSPEPQSSSA